MFCLSQSHTSPLLVFVLKAKQLSNHQQQGKRCELETSKTFITLDDTNSKSSIITAHHIQYFTATIQGWKHLLKPDKYKDVINNRQSFSYGERKMDRATCLLYYGNHMQPGLASPGWV